VLVTVEAVDASLHEDPLLGMTGAFSDRDAPLFLTISQSLIMPASKSTWRHLESSRWRELQAIERVKWQIYKHQGGAECAAHLM
jgi:hypothetical protein